MFHNETASLVQSSQKILTHHDVIYFGEFTNAHLFLLFLPVMIMNSQRVRLIRKILGKVKFLKDTLNVQQFDNDFNLKVDLNENLGNYWKCISGIDQKRWYAKELYLRYTQKIRTIDDYNLTLMGLSGRGDKCISNTCNYDILQNEKYADAFFYT